MGSVTATTAPSSRKPASRRQSIALVTACTLLGAAGQILIKMGANTLAQTSPLAMLTNAPLLAGYTLYGLMTVLFVFALRDEELSIVYPIISLNYVWVTALSVIVFREKLNLARTVGVLIIVLGVCVLGRDAKK